MSEAPGSSEEISPLDWYRALRSRIEHEDSLVVQRLSWLVASQSFLFTAYAITTNGLSSAVPKGQAIFAQQQMLLFRLIPLVAIGIALLIHFSIVAALRAIRELRRTYLGRGQMRGLPEIQTKALTRRLGLTAPLILPLLFVGVWLLLFLHGWAGSPGQ